VVFWGTLRGRLVGTQKLEREKMELRRKSEASDVTLIEMHSERAEVRLVCSRRPGPSLYLLQRAPALCVRFVPVEMPWCLISVVCVRARRAAFWFGLSAIHTAGGRAKEDRPARELVPHVARTAEAGASLTEQGHRRPKGQCGKCLKCTACVLIVHEMCWQNLFCYHVQ
jgi:hypothetical protein